MQPIAACAAFLTSIVAVSVPAGRTSADLPLDEWIEAAEELGTVHVRYRVTNREGETVFVDLTMAGTDRAYFLFEKEGGGAQREIWVDVGSMTHLINEDGGPLQTYSVDMASALEAPVEWLVASTEALGVDGIEIPAPRTQVSLWPQDDPETTWQFNVSTALTTSSPFGWLEILRRSEYTADEVDTGYVVTLETGAVVDLDGTTGFILGILIDPDDESAGIVVAETFELDVEVDDDLFRPDVPDSAEALDQEALQAQWDLTAWRYVRIEWTSALLREATEADDFLEANDEALRERAGAFYVESFAHAIERSVDDMKESVDERADQMLEIWERTKGMEGAREAFDAAREQLEGAITKGCTERGDVHAQRLVVPPFESDEPALEALLDLEREAAAAALREAFLDPVLEHVAERFSGVDDGAPSGRSTR